MTQDIGGPEWFYSIPEARRTRYLAQREALRVTWWDNRLHNQAVASAASLAMDRLRDELVRDFPPTTQAPESKTP